MTTEPPRNGHLPINGLSLYHEVYGELGASSASPLLLIPGAFMGTDSMRVSSQGVAPVDHAVWGGIQGFAIRASRMASMGRRPWLRALTR